MVLKIIGVLLVVWIVFAVLSFIFKQLFWLAIIGGVLFLGYTAYAAITRNPRRELR